MVQGEPGLDGALCRASKDSMLACGVTALTSKTSCWPHYLSLKNLIQTRLFQNFNFSCVYT